VKERWLFLGLALLLVPIWAVDYVPTVDGPSHVYNAWILRQYHNVEEYPLFQQHYEIDWRPIPNWFGNAVLALLMFPFAPRTAEKILLSGIVLLFVAAVRFFAGSADPERRWAGVLALPLLYNHLFLLGFHNFSFSLSFYMLAVGTWWRNRDSPGLPLALELNLLLLLCWFSHIVSLCVALASIGILWLVTLRGRDWKRHLLHPLMLAPQVLLPLWFVQQQGGGPIPSIWSPETVRDFLMRLEVLLLFGDEQLWIGRILAGLFGVLLLLTLAGKLKPREEDGFLLLVLLTIGIYIVSPEGMSGGTLLKNRLSLYPWLVLLPWLAPPIGRVGRVAVIAVAALLTIFQVGKTVHWYRQMQPDIQAFVAAAESIPRNSRVLPLLFSRDTTNPRFGALGHLLGYAAAEKGLIDWDNYEAATSLFPVRFRPWVRKPDTYILEADPAQVRLAQYRGRADHVFAWKMPPDLPLARQVRRKYRLLAEIGPGAVYQRRKGRGMRE
jgi:hypothetical protein